MTPQFMGGAPSPGRNNVPVQTILVTIGLVLASGLALLLVYRLSQVIVWMVIAAFFAVALSPVVGVVERRVGGRRWLATLLVFFAGLLVLAGLVALFVVPLVREGTRLTQNLPDYLDQVKSGQGEVGDLAVRLHVQ